ncbi:unnamed protein product [Adineta ricciae]|uniref:EGF-like domain-containing protein n=1 Tax=Adineta ricciae TaxID=249248 RepID=A0A814ICX2_ADIRI|nr:unnamed protein product [Adineta ricciae]CAF1558933.1 unnamed protein product [Adineta ricciae]
MATHITNTSDQQQQRQMIYNNRTYVRTMYTSTTNQFFHPSSKSSPVSSVNVCDYLLYETKLAEDVGSATSSSYIRNNELYDNAYSHTYDNPIECLESYNVKQSLINLPQGNRSLSDNIKDENIANDDEDKYGSSNSPHSTSPILFYLENRRLALYACLISFLLLFLLGIGIFLLYRLLRPVVITTTVNNHYAMMNASTISPTLLRILTQSTTQKSSTSVPFSYSMCPPDRWGMYCKNICKPCGLGVCHTITGQCICPDDIYGEFCDLTKVNDKPKRGDMMS